MAADPTLVRGAYLAAGGGIDKTKEYAAYNQLANTAFTQLNTLVKERSDEFKEYMKFELERDPGLNEEERGVLYNDLLGKRMDYITGTGQERGVLMGELASKKAQYDELDLLKKEIALKANDSKTGFASNNIWMASKQGQSIFNAMQGAPVEQEVNGRKVYGYMISDNKGDESFMTTEQIRNLVNEQSFDGGAQDALNELTTSAIEQSSKLIHANNPEFQYDQVSMSIGNALDQANLRSVKYDNIIQGRSLYDDLQEVIQNQTYKGLGLQDFGLDMDQVKAMDPDGDGTISDDDAREIVDKLFEDEAITKQYATTYFTNYVKQNWDAAAKNRKDYNKVINKDTSKTVFNGYEYERDGNMWKKRLLGSDDNWSPTLLPTAEDLAESEVVDEEEVVEDVEQVLPEFKYLEGDQLESVTKKIDKFNAGELKFPELKLEYKALSGRKGFERKIKDFNSIFKQWGFEMVDSDQGKIVQVYAPNGTSNQFEIMKAMKTDLDKVAEKINDWMKANLEIASKPEYVAGQTTF